jgi:hypothetical protein
VGKREFSMTCILTNLVAREVDCMVVVALEKDGMVLSEVVLCCWRIVNDTRVILKSITIVL